MQAKIAAIYISPVAHWPMQWVPYARTIAGIGLEGDRYALDIGTYSGKPNRSNPKMCVRHVTFISARMIELGNQKLDHRFVWEDTRRNVVINGDIDPLSLIGKEFLFGSSRFRGFEDCTPCTIPSMISGKPEFEKAFKIYGGIRAEILTSGIIRLDDKLYVA